MISGRIAQATTNGGPTSTSQRTNRRRAGEREAGTEVRVADAHDPAVTWA